jgi:uncharacterized membrane protein
MMKFTCSVDIDSPKQKVAAMFADPNNLQYVQEGFKSKTLISGNEGEEGAVSKMVYEKLELIETIIKNDLPDSFLALYEHKYTVNTMEVHFEVLSEHRTRYNSKIHYTEFNGLMIKIMAKLFPRFFKKQVLKWMQLFKVYVESKN